MKFTIGADPELFLVDKTTNNVVSAIGIIPGEKGNAYRSEDMPEGFGLEIDNILAEFNIPPCTTREGFINNIEYMKNYIRNYVQRINPNLDIQCVASRHVNADQLTSPEAKRFGCSVDYNAYSQAANPKPKGEQTNLRSAGFHIHVGYENPNVNTSLKLIKIMDITLGIPSVVLDPDTERRSLYGKAGAFRLTPYGFEYRVLSSKMMSSVDMLNHVWNGIVQAMRGDYMSLPSRVVQDIINNSDVNAAQRILKQCGICVE